MGAAVAVAAGVAKENSLTVRCKPVENPDDAMMSLTL